MGPHAKANADDVPAETDIFCILVRILCQKPPDVRPKNEPDAKREERNLNLTYLGYKDRLASRTDSLAINRGACLSQTCQLDPANASLQAWQVPKT